MRVVLWDVDGTLLRNGRRAGALYDEAIRAVTGLDPGGQAPVEHGKTDAQIIAERLDLLGADPGLRAAVQRRLDLISVAGTAGANAREIAPGVERAIAAIADAGWANGLLTGNSAARVRAKFAGAGLDAGRFDWTHSYFGHDALVRADLTRAAARDLAGTAAVIVGDTPADGAAARAAALPFIAVATGAFTIEQLAGSAALAVLPDLERGLAALLAALESLAR